MLFYIAQPWPHSSLEVTPMSGLSLWPLMQDSRPVFDGLSLHSVMKFHFAILGTLTEQRTVPATTCTILCSANPSLHSPVSSKMLMMTVSFKKTLNKAYLSLSYVWKKRMVAGPGFSFISLIFTFSIQSFLSISLVLYDFRKFCGLYLYIFFNRHWTTPYPDQRQTGISPKCPRGQ